MDKKWISIGDIMHEFRTNRMLTDRDRTSNRCLCPCCLVEIFEHAQNFPPEERTSPDIAIYGTDSPEKKRI